MKRIRPEEIVEAYKKVSFRPTWRSYGHSSKGDVHCGCPLSALACSLGMDEDPEYVDAGAAPDFLAHEHGYDQGYLCGFIAGIDGGKRQENPVHPHQKAANIGHDDGTAAWMAVCDNFTPVW